MHVICESGDDGGVWSRGCKSNGGLVKVQEGGDRREEEKG